MRPSVYLAGPISGLNYGRTVNWRQSAQAMLAPEIETFSPMRGKDYLNAEERIGTLEYPHLLSTDKGVVARDRFDVMKRDLILANLAGVDRVSIGTVGEIFWADAFRKPIVAVFEPGSVHDHPMLRQLAGWIAHDVEEACWIARRILLS